MEAVNPYQAPRMFSDDEALSPNADISTNDWGAFIAVPMLTVFSVLVAATGHASNLLAGVMFTYGAVATVLCMVLAVAKKSGALFLGSLAIPISMIMRDGFPACVLACAVLGLPLAFFQACLRPSARTWFYVAAMVVFSLVAALSLQVLGFVKI